MTPVRLRVWLDEQDANRAFTATVNELLEMVPEGFEFESNEWNVAGWSTRPGNTRVRTLDFGKFINNEFASIAKLWILHERMTKTIGKSSAIGKLSAVQTLDSVLSGKSFQLVKSDDFKIAERRLSEKWGPGTAFRMASHLQSLASWLSVTFGLRLNYKNALRNPTVHGRYGSEEGRQAKLIPLETLRDLVAANSRSNLSRKDAFFLSAFTVNVAAGFRISEMATLPGLPPVL